MTAEIYQLRPELHCRDREDALREAHRALRDAQLKRLIDEPLRKAFDDYARAVAAKLLKR